ncbi:Carboxylesterase A [Kordia antarctica]|uniref:Carboxylesterase A n=1 Tax=Kordia antarctica TaxID=1218801 RepID=A0A7L4ZFE5_9FLAO|nr:alpha/beta fold hydrolase [Kordia antarctica]QHI35392.1 Carboxylesterase A [Kordia antarctica]
MTRTTIILKLFIFAIVFSGWSQNVSLDKADSFFPYADILNEDTITWHYLSVPENWEKPESNTIKIAVSVLKNKANLENAPAVVFIQGGPGASGVQNIGSWVNHVLRENNDIVLFDIRGTGYSEPRLCPDLGAEFLTILAKNQSPEKDEEDKTNVAFSCKQELIKNGVDTDAYHSLSVAKDLNALRSKLGYSKWIVYGASYGTYMAQVYASYYPNDVQSLILDSSIADISDYYTENTSNYMTSLGKVFNACKNDADCNAEFPNLEEDYYAVIADLTDNPITVSVSKNIVESEEFTFNAEDFKIAIQQTLYNKQFIEIMPLLISQFKERNKDALGTLVASFSSLLGLDYGVYYCVSCNEALPNNDIQVFESNAAQYGKLKGGLSFYKSDFKVCEKWNLSKPDSLAQNYDLSGLANVDFPVIVISGEYDPITPLTNGEKVAKKFKNAYAVTGYTYGHVPGFTFIGNEVIGAFTKNPSQQPDAEAFKQAAKMQLVSNVTVNPGVSNMGNSIGQMDPLFLAPLAIAFLIMIAYIFIYSFNLVRKKYQGVSNKIIRIITIITSIIGLVTITGLVLALLEVMNKNFFILAFGLPENFNYLFTLTIVFTALTLISLVFFIVRIKKISDRSIMLSVLFSHMLLITYMFHWGIISL